MNSKSKVWVLAGLIVILLAGVGGALHRAVSRRRSFARCGHAMRAINRAILLYGDLHRRSMAEWRYPSRADLEASGLVSGRPAPRLGYDELPRVDLSPFGWRTDPAPRSRHPGDYLIVWCRGHQGQHHVLGRHGQVQRMDAAGFAGRLAHYRQFVADLRASQCEGALVIAAPPAHVQAVYLRLARQAEAAPWSRVPKPLPVPPEPAPASAPAGDDVARCAAIISRLAAHELLMLRLPRDQLPAGARPFADSLHARLVAVRDELLAKGDAAVAALEPLLDGDQAAVAIELLGSIRTDRSARALARYMPRVRHYWDEPRVVARALARIGRPAVPAILEVLFGRGYEHQTPPGPVQTILEQALLGLDPLPIGALMRALESDSERTRRAAGRVLGLCGGVAVPYLVGRLRAGDPSVLPLLGPLGTRARPAVPFLIRRLGDANFEIRRWAAHLLGRVSPADDIVLPALIEVLSTDALRVRVQAADSLRLLRQGATPARARRIDASLAGYVAEPGWLRRRRSAGLASRQWALLQPVR